MATAEQVERAEAELVEAKKAGSKAKVAKAVDKAVTLRQEYRAAEEAAGRRQALAPGGDARKVD